MKVARSQQTQTYQPTTHFPNGAKAEYEAAKNKGEIFY